MNHIMQRGICTHISFSPCCRHLVLIVTKKLKRRELIAVSFGPAFCFLSPELLAGLATGWRVFSEVSLLPTVL